MQYIIKTIVNLIASYEPESDGEMIVMINGFQDISIYEMIAQNLEAYYKTRPLKWKIKLAKRKWEILRSHADTSTIQSMEQNSWIADKESITYYRNLHDTNVLVLMGAEDEDDTGGFMNCFTITPEKLLQDLRGDYSKVFADAFHGLETEEYKECVNKVFRNLFEFVPADICRLDLFSQKWSEQFDTVEEFIEEFFETLPEWGLPAQKIEHPTQKDIQKRANFLRQEQQFISRQMFKKLSKTQYKKYQDQIENYAQNDGKYSGSWAGWKNQGFTDYNEFSKTLLSFIRGESVQENKNKLLKVDYTISEDILDIKISKTDRTSRGITNLVGEPLEVFLIAVLTMLSEVKEHQVGNGSKIEIEIKQAEMVTGFTDNDDDEKCKQLLDAWKNICVHVNGIFAFISAADWRVDGVAVDIICRNQNIFNPLQGTLDQGVIKAAGTTNTLNKIMFTMKYKDNEDKITSFVNGEGKKQNIVIDFCWKFKNESCWMHDFSDFVKQEICTNTETIIPLVSMKDIKDIFRAKSVEEFFDMFDARDLIFGFNAYDYVKNKIKTCSEMMKFVICFEELGKAYGNFAKNVADTGFYSCLLGDRHELSCLRAKYNDLAKLICRTSFPENARWIMDIFIHAFNIVENTTTLLEEDDIECCIVPPWHPAVLQKLQDQKQFILDGVYNWWMSADIENSIRKLDIINIVNEFSHMAEIQGAVDLFPASNQFYLGELNAFGRYFLYGKDGIKPIARIKDLVKKEAIYDDDFKASELTKMNADAVMLFDVVKEYVKALPSASYNLSIVFINPTDLQPVIAAIYHYVSDITRGEGISVNIQLKILVKPENKGGRSYLAYWMDEFFSKDENINVRTYLNEYSTSNDLKRLLNGNNDIVFHMGVLHVSEFSFVPDNAVFDNGVTGDECRFPIVNRPTPLSYTSKKRKIELSQPQFSSSFLHTQVVKYRNNADTVPKDKRFIAVKESIFGGNAKDIINILHDKAYWVVCVDTVMDGALLKYDEEHDYSIIGYSTGKGKYGQYNLTITARKSILETVENRFRSRLQMLFHWDAQIIDKATKRVIEEARKLDGISLLSAINQSDYNINEFMAYVLTSMREKEKVDNSALRILIHLDSYKHWFKDYGNSNKRPDFLMLSVLTADDVLKIKGTVIECKIAGVNNIENHIVEAQEQVVHGLECLKKIFDPHSDSLKRRYWYTQLYRALVYAQVTFSDDTAEFSAIASRLRSILNGKFEIDWNGEILGYCFDMPGDEDKCTVTGSEDIKIYRIPQMRIQRILLNSKDNVDFIDIKRETIYSPEEEEYKQNEMRQELEEEIGEINALDKAAAILESISVITSEKEPILREEKSEARADNLTYEKKTPLMDGGKDKPEIIDGETDLNGGQSETALNKDILSEIRILIGKAKLLNDVYWEFGNRQLANRHMLITGTSGQGKTYSIQAMLYEISNSNISSVIFDYTEGFRIDQLERKFLEKMSDRINQNIVYFTGVPINPFKRHTIEIAGASALEKISDVAQRIANILTHVYGFGEQQFAAIYDSSRVGLEKYGNQMNMTYLKEELEKCSNKSAKTVASKMAPFFHSVDFTHTGFDWENILYPGNGKVTIFQLTSFVREIQVIITEFMLWDMWHYTKKYGNKEKPFVVVLDEAQNLSHTLDSPSGMILTEGRKFGWSAWYATQSLKLLSDDEVVRLMQSACKLYFKPTDEEIVQMAKQLNPSNVNEWRTPLSNLKKGYCIVVGDRVRSDGKFGNTKPTITSVTSFEER